MAHSWPSGRFDDAGATVLGALDGRPLRRVVLTLRRPLAARVAGALSLVAFWQILVWRYDVATYPRLAAIGFTGAIGYVAAAWLFESGIGRLLAVPRGQPIAVVDDRLLRTN